MNSDKVHNIILAVVGSLALIIFNDMRSDISVLSENVQKLNHKLATVVNNQLWYKEQLKAHNDRIKSLEVKMTPVGR